MKGVRVVVGPPPGHRLHSPIDYWRRRNAEWPKEGWKTCDDARGLKTSAEGPGDSGRQSIRPFTSTNPPTFRSPDIVAVPCAVVFWCHSGRPAPPELWRLPQRRAPSEGPLPMDTSQSFASFTATLIDFAT